MVEEAAARSEDYLSDEKLQDWQTNAQWLESTANLEPAEVELALRHRISYVEDVLWKQRDRLSELEKSCEQAEATGQDAAYEMFEAQWEQVEENITTIESEHHACNQIMQEKYYQQRLATAESGTRKHL